MQLHHPWPYDTGHGNACQIPVVGLVTLQDVIDFAETHFECVEGCWWRWADIACSKPYVWLAEAVTGMANDEAEHMLATRCIAALQLEKDKAGYKGDMRPKLYWRWSDKVRLEYDRIDAEHTMQLRYYIDGHYTRPVMGNPSKPRGRPTVGQVRLAA